LKRRQRKKQEKQEDSLNLSQRVNVGSDSTLPEDYFISINCSSGYRSIIVNDTIKEKEEGTRQDQSDNEQESEAKLLTEHIPKEHTLED